MIDFACMTLLHEINAKLKPSGKSYALIGNNANLRLYHNTGSETVEMCQCNAKLMYTILTTIHNNYQQKGSTT